MGVLVKQLLGIPLQETRCEQRGFAVVDVSVKKRIEQVGEAFVFGYHAALLNPKISALTGQLESLPREIKGFAYEGAAMALALLDLMTPWRHNRLQLFLQGPGDAHTYMMHVGAGWAMARIPWGLSYLKRLDPLLKWLAIDGYGFHHGYFHWPRYVDQQRKPGGMSGYLPRAFDQGLGRSLWFSQGAQVDRITSLIAAFDSTRHGDLWSGLGLAAAYAGGVSEGDLLRFKSNSGAYLPNFAQGVTFAAKARLRAGNETEHTQMACKVICDMDIEPAAGLTDQALLNLPDDGVVPAYEHWRLRIQENFIT